MEEWIRCTQGCRISSSWLFRCGEFLALCLGGTDLGRTECCESVRWERFVHDQYPITTEFTPGDLLRRERPSLLDKIGR
jgi:hypothetical protein